MSFWNFLYFFTFPVFGVMTLNTGNVKKYRKFQNDMLKTRQLPSIE